MTRMDRIRSDWAPRSLIVSIVAAAVFQAPSAFAQNRAAAPARGAAAASPPGKAQAAGNAAPEKLPEGRVVRVPINPGDPAAVVNGEVITRASLANECLMRKGEEILDTLIHRLLLEQELKRQKITITQVEIDAEIDRVAMQMAGVTREIWLRTLSKDRGISPAQYSRDIIYPALALSKLAKPKVQVTEEDVKEAYESNFGEKMTCRIIMCANQRHVIELWEQLKKNPGAFEKMAKEDPRSIDQSTRAMGGMLLEPLSRHAYPRNVTDKAFEQLVDGDPDDSDPAHKPKDGDISGPIQAGSTPTVESAWVLVKREKVIPARKYDPKDPEVRKQMEGLIFDAKLKDKMQEVFNEVIRNAAIENRLTGAVKMAREDEHEDSRVDGQVKLMSDPANAPKPTAGAKAGEAGGPGALPKSRIPPRGVSEADLRARESQGKAITKGQSPTQK